MNPILLDIPTEIPTDRLLLRSYRAGDGAAYYNMVEENRDHLHEFLPAHVLALKNADDAEIVIRKLVAEWQLRNLFLFGMWEKATGSYIGETYLANADWDVPCIELGYFLVKASTGKGYATEAAHAIIRFAFEHLMVSRIALQIAAGNTASALVAERCGFLFEGCLRQRHPRKDGLVVDRLWYGLLRSEWKDAV